MEEERRGHFGWLQVRKEVCIPIIITVDLSKSFILDNLVLFPHKEELSISAHWEGGKLPSGKRIGRHHGKRRRKSMENLGKTSEKEVFVLFRQITFPYCF